MRWRGQKPRLSVHWTAAETYELVCPMAYKMYAAFIASLSVALTIASNETFARSASRGGFTSTHSISHPSVAHSLRHRRRNNVGTLWPAVGDFFYGPSNGEPGVDFTQPTSGDIPYDVPWDWAHRYPPVVIPSERPYVPSCPTETVTVPGLDGKEQTVSIMRCY
jgi:hypothetical protein